MYKRVAAGLMILCLLCGCGAAGQASGDGAAGNKTSVETSVTDAGNKEANSSTAGTDGTGTSDAGNNESASAAETSTQAEPLPDKLVYDSDLESTAPAELTGEIYTDHTTTFIKDGNYFLSLFDGTYVKVEEQPYYVGKQDSSFLESVKGQYDEVLFLTDKIYLEKPEEYTVSDTSVAKIEGNFVVPLKQGLFEMNGRRYAVTTFNDGKDVVNETTIKPNFVYGVYDAETWQSTIHTISDMIAYIQSKHFCYTYVEPNEGWFGDGWMWTGDPKAIMAYNQGVCEDICQLAAYMLAGDFEDWGCILTNGTSGHIFNWFYEDGKYYVVDFTKMISYNTDNDWEQVNPAKWRKIIYTYTDFAAMAEDINFDYVSPGTYSVLCISYMGHTFQSIKYNNLCSHVSEEVKEILKNKEEVTIYFEKCLEGHIEEVYRAHDNIKIGFFEDAGIEIPVTFRTNPTCCYGWQLRKIR